MLALCVCLVLVIAALSWLCRGRARLVELYRDHWSEANRRLAEALCDRDEAVETAAVLEAQRDHACDRHEQMGQALAETRDAMDQAHSRLREEARRRQRADAAIYSALSSLESYHKAA